LLLLLGSLNIASGVFQLHQISLAMATPGGPPGMTSPQYIATPLPILLHIVFGALFNLAVPLQFVTAVRRGKPALHRWLGGVLIASGAMAALTGLWMNQVFPAFGTGLKYAAVLIFSCAMLIALAMAVRSVRRRDFRAHGVWIACAVAIGLAPATQRLVLLPVFLVLGDLPILLIEAVVWASFIVNLTVAGLVRRRRRTIALDAPPGGALRS